MDLEKFGAGHLPSLPRFLDNPHGEFDDMLCTLLIGCLN